MQWSCPLCTFLNTATHLQCTMCSTIRPTQNVTQNSPAPSPKPVDNVVDLFGSPPTAFRPPALPPALPTGPAPAPAPARVPVPAPAPPPPLHEPSETFLKLLNSNSNTNNYSLFIDPSFPPTSSIIDGRGSTSATTKPLPNCKCGKTCQVKKVSKESKNNNRLYATCYLNATWRSRTLPVPDPKSTSNSTPTPKPCDFFRFLDPSEVPPTSKASKAHFAPVAAPLKTLSSLTPSSSSSWLTPKISKLSLWGKEGPVAADVSQGSLGDCWFVSALSVIASSSESRIRSLFSAPPNPNDLSSNPGGAYEIHLFVDGHFESIIVDSYLPVHAMPVGDQPHTSLPPKAKKAKTLHNKQGLVMPTSTILPSLTAAGASGSTSTCVPMYSKCTQNHLWAPLVEKAYAKRHGSYDSLSGGWVWEAFLDLLGAPVEVIYLSALANKGPDVMDTAWFQLLSFLEAKFVLGVSCMRSSKEEDLVGFHAYSLLDAIEIHEDVTLGEQTKIDSHFTSSSEVQIVGTAQNRKSLRLVRVRNPWGKKGFTGEFGEKDDRWTKKLRRLVNYQVSDQGKGDFWMSFENFVQKFESIDVCKVREDWVNQSIADFFTPSDNPYAASSFSYASSTSFLLTPNKPTWLYLMTVQRKRRGGPVSTGAEWLCDINFALYRRPKGESSDSGPWQSISLHCSGETRLNNAETMLEKGFQYRVVPFTTKAVQERIDFRFVVYSSVDIKVEKFPLTEEETVFGGIQKNTIMQILRLSKPNQSLPVGPGVVLSVFSISSMTFFVLENGSELTVSADFTMKGEGYRTIFSAREKGGGGAVLPQRAKLVSCIVANKEALSLHFEINADVGTGVFGNTKDSFMCRELSEFDIESCKKRAPPAFITFGPKSGNLLMINQALK